jgi:A/G-specific adenine glycosylase
MTSSLPFAVPLLEWYDHNARVLPWRVPPSPAGIQKPDPYKIWLSESMLQQTTVASVKAYFDKFTTLWPTVQDLARADRDDVLTAWAGLGYYARARNLHACANTVVAVHGGAFPQDEQTLKTLAGIGAYTAAAIAAIAFGKRAVVVDGNIERIISRYFAVQAILPAGRPVIYQFTDGVTPDARAGDFAQAMMDLGSTVCMPRNPQCLLCPLQRGCQAFKAGTMTQYPRKAPKKARPTRYGWVFLIHDSHGDVLIRQRPDTGLLGGLWEFPSSDWTQTPLTTQMRQVTVDMLPVIVNQVQVLECPPIKHTFTHFDLFLSPVKIMAQRGSKNTARWVAPPDLKQYALPTLMTKVWKATTSFS